MKKMSLLVLICVYLFSNLLFANTFEAEKKIEIENGILFNRNIVLLNDDKHIAFIKLGESNEINIYNIDNQEIIKKILLPEEIISKDDYNSVVISSIKNANKLFIISEKEIAILNIDNEKIEKRIKLNTKLNKANCTLSHDGKYLYYVDSSKKNIIIVNIEKEVILEKNIPNKILIDLIESSNNNQFLFLVSKKNIYKMDINDNKIVKEFNGHKKDITSIKITPNDKLLLSGDKDGFIKVWDIETGKKIRDIEINEKGSSHGISKIEISSNGKYVLSSPYLNFSKEKLWEIDNGKLLRIFDTGSGVRAIDIIFSSTNDLLILTSIRDIKIFNSSMEKKEIKPFGIALNKELSADIKVEDIDDSLKLIKNVPQPNNLFESYAVTVNKENKVVSLTALSNSYVNDEYCFQSKANYDSIKEILISKYGISTDSFDSLIKGSIWNEGKDYKTSLAKKERIHTDSWESVFNDSSVEITLSENADMRGCFIKITYVDKKLFEKYKKEQLKSEKNSF